MSTQERVFFDNNGVTVTNTRFVVPSQTYAMAGITSVQFFTDKPSWVPVFVCFAITALTMAGNNNIWVVGMPFLTGVALLFRRPVHHVVLSVSSGETRALNSKDKQHIAAVIHALNEAIIARG